VSSSISWPSAGPLPPSPRIFLEASAGTGKTFAIEGIVVQLVAEAGIPIDKILVITFTKAATAELSDRVRQRLAKVLQVLQGSVQAGGDVLAARLVNAPDCGLLVTRLARALADIDRAPISTIHSFCQRMLQELAFESGQEAELEVLGEASEVRKQLVADELARTYAHAGEADLALLADMGWTPGGLRAVAKEMTGATAPTPRPSLDRSWRDPLQVVTAWRRRLEEFQQWWEGPAGRAAVHGWQAEVGLPTKTDAKGKLPYNRLSGAPKNVDGVVRAWLASGGPRGDRPFKKAAAGWLDREGLSRKWNAVAGPVQDFAGYPLAVEFTKLCHAQDRLWAQPLVQFASAVRQDYLAEIERRAQLTYDGMLSRLAERLVQDAKEGVSVLADAIRNRYRAALVDEFQDTDASQWQVLDHVFGREDARFFVVGDPKQSIYRFRGADLDVYLTAREQAVCYQLDTNFRTDRPLVSALNKLWTDADLPLSRTEAGEAVRYLPVKAHQELRIQDLPPSAGAADRPRRPLELRLCSAATDGGSPESAPNKADMMEVLAQVCARECLTLLRASPSIASPDKAQTRTLAPGDVAILVANHLEARTVSKYLASFGIPAVAAGRGSIFNSEALGWLVAWLDALASPANERPARQLAVSPLIGWTADQLTRAVAEAGGGARLDDDQLAWHALRQHLATLTNSWSTQGFARVLDKTLATYDVLARLLGSLWGERGATDLRHLTELCQAEDRRTRAGPRGLAEWLRARKADADDKNDEQATRLESDAAAVQLVTIHACKGLEYPVVLMPFAWPPWTENEANQPLLVRVGAASVLDMSVSGTEDRARSMTWSDQAFEAESVRLLYVAMTRARHHVVAWLNRCDPEAQGPLARLILRGDRTGLGSEAPVVSGKRDGPNGADKMAAWNQRISAQLQDIQDSSQDSIGWSEEPPPRQEETWRPEGAAPLVLATARAFDPTLQLGTRWQVASFSSLSAGRGADDDEPTRALAKLATTPTASDNARVQDEGDEPTPVDLDTLGDLARHAWMLDKAAGADLPGGTTTGDWIHGVFEELDFSAEHDPAGQAKDGRTAKQLIDDLAQRHGVTVHKGKPVPQDGLLALLPAWLDTPLAGSEHGAFGLPDDFTLRSLTLAHRIDELGFDLRLGAGANYRLAARNAEDRDPGCIDTAGVRDAFEIGAAAEGFGGAAWCRAMLERTDDKVKALLPGIAGFLTGFIDLTFRVRASGASARYYLADYKSNAIRGPEWLAARMAQAVAPGVEAPRLANIHYTRPLLQWAMAHAGYHLQALIYTVALHRLLQTRLGSEYDYDSHIGGHLYLFLKGMAGPNTPRWQGSCLGVWADRWPKAAVLALDRALLGGSWSSGSAEAP